VCSLALEYLWIEVVESIHYGDAAGCTPPTSREIHSNKAGRVARKMFAAKRAGGCETRRGFFNYGCAAAGTQDVAWMKSVEIFSFNKFFFYGKKTYHKELNVGGGGDHIPPRKRRKRTQGKE